MDYRKIRVDFEKQKIVGIHMDSSRSTWILLKSTLNFNLVFGVDSNNWRGLMLKKNSTPSKYVDYGNNPYEVLKNPHGFFKIDVDSTKNVEIHMDL